MNARVGRCWSCGADPGGDFLCRQCGRIQPPDPSVDFFTLLNLPLSPHPAHTEMDNRYREIQQTIHPDRFTTASPLEQQFSMQQVVRLNEAYQTLGNALQCANYLLSLLGGVEDFGERHHDAGFLMGVMELRETLEEAETRQNVDELDALRREIDHRIRQEETSCGQALQALAGGNDLARQEAATHLNRWRYYQRFQEEVERVEERLLG
ncbi:MAG: Fe-S protein assembly co-chaperone HscB [Magnetococcales bacterium]|nr:Fe-S protein assembly co-chaperone HscB [Magnetococcales bacterium]